MTNDYRTLLIYNLGYKFGHLLSYHLVYKRSLHVRSQGLEIFTLIEEKKLKLPTTTITKKD